MITHAPEVCYKDTKDKISSVLGSLRNDVTDYLTCKKPFGGF